ncbi:hypothetical protein JTB14_034492 [Gonioctena quinquepunctata]|nr:hypothetical protein JTB14_034492 [Gonioctena quinquepunctata]
MLVPESCENYTIGRTRHRKGITTELSPDEEKISEIPATKNVGKNIMKPENAPEKPTIITIARTDGPTDLSEDDKASDEYIPPDGGKKKRKSKKRKRNDLEKSGDKIEKDENPSARKIIPEKKDKP